MARLYLFICDCCGATQQRDSEALPDGWAMLVSGRGRRDVCSFACASNSRERLQIADAPTQPQLAAPVVDA